MYPEFTAIYIGLSILISLGIVIIVLLIRILKCNSSDSSPKLANKLKSQSHMTATENIAFCKNCASQLNESDRVCPNCGIPR